MSNNDSFDPADRKDSKKSPLVNPASPPESAVKNAAGQTGAQGSAATPGSPVGVGGHTGTSRTSNVSGSPGSSGVTGTTGIPASTSRPGSKVSPTDAAAPGEARDAAGVPINKSPPAAGSVGSANAGSRSDAAGAPPSAESRASGQSQKPNGGTKATGEQLREKAQEANRSASEKGRAGAEAHRVDESHRKLPQKLENRGNSSVASQVVHFTQEHPRMVAIAGAIATAAGFLLARSMRSSKRKSDKIANPSPDLGYRDPDLDRSFTQESEQGHRPASPMTTPRSSIGTGYDQGGRSRL